MSLAVRGKMKPMRKIQISKEKKSKKFRRKGKRGVDRKRFHTKLHLSDKPIFPSKGNKEKKIKIWL